MLINLIESKPPGISWTSLNKVIEGIFCVETDDSRYSRLSINKHSGFVKPAFSFDVINRSWACATKWFTLVLVVFFSIAPTIPWVRPLHFPKALKMIFFFKFSLFANNPFTNKSKVSLSLIDRNDYKNMYMQFIRIHSTFKLILVVCRHNGFTLYERLTGFSANTSASPVWVIFSLH